MVNAQEWLNKNFPKKQRGEITSLNLSGQKLEGKLDLSDFVKLTILNSAWNHQLTQLDLSKNVNLTEIWCSSNQLTILDLSKNTNLVVISAYRNNISQDLNTFSHLNKLKRLDLGLEKNYLIHNGKNNNFSGSLASLKDCQDLEYICIGNQPNVKGGLEFLPAEKLTYFGCFDTIFKEILKPYNYDVYAWQLVNYPPKFNLADLQTKITETKQSLAEPKLKEGEKSRLQSKLNLLEQKLQEQLQQPKEKNAIQNYLNEKESEPKPGENPLLKPSPSKIKTDLKDIYDLLPNKTKIGISIILLILLIWSIKKFAKSSKKRETKQTETKPPINPPITNKEKPKTPIFTPKKQTSKKPKSRKTNKPKRTQSISNLYKYKKTNE